MLNANVYLFKDKFNTKIYTFRAILLREHKGLPMTIMKVM